eukprot:gnl/TRDRNA2_/TRDRNA2_28234_c0_seq1.p1 gnl/TRDRNA2_/TRDRNA2_28234_c0~~gnl/TRDRNA2_/TRDRNA2_28234_c0_seq1.p1  ORF type:complete len:119 (-),score=31.75 gnl/TRDRNA2_/TRDRNA2_28234_c0_seq1:119-475(-)
MAAEEVKLRLIFANEDSTQEISMNMSTTVKDAKRDIMEKYWPPSLTSIENVERLRLFAGGKELGGKEADDMKSLRDAKLTVSQNFPTPVHVCTVLKSAEQAVSEKEMTKPSQCFCIVL